jgi:hypothetical protein
MIDILVRPDLRPCTGKRTGADRELPINRGVCSGRCGFPADLVEMVAEILEDRPHRFITGLVSGLARVAMLIKELFAAV